MIITNNNFKIVFNGLAIFFIAFSIRTCIAYLTYGGGDATNGASFIDFYNNGYDIYSNISPWPYLPFSNSLLWAWDSISNLLGISVNLSYRLFSSFFDSSIAVLIFYYLHISNRTSSVKLSLIYALNPITIIISATLGFTDSFALIFLIIIIIASDLKDIKYKDLMIGFFLAASIACKPIAVIFVPYFFYRSFNKVLFFISLIVSLILLNSYYLFGASLSNNIEVVSLVLEKLALGHQAGKLGVGTLTEMTGMGLTKVFTILGLPILAVVYILKINSRAADFILIIFTILLLFRYNFHPQYMAWLVPFIIIANRDFFTYIAIGGLSLVVIIFDWNDSAGAFSLLNAFKIDRVNFESQLLDIYQYLASPIFLGVFFLLSILMIHKREFYISLFVDIKMNFLLLPRISLVNFSLILIASFLMGFLFLLLVSIEGTPRIGGFLRAIFLIFLPSSIMFYLLLKADIKYRYTTLIIMLIAFIASLSLSYYLLIQGYKRPYNGAFAYVIIILPITMFILFSKSGIFHKMVVRKEYKEELMGGFSFKVIFVLMSLILASLLIFSWNNLYYAASNQFIFDVSDEKTPVRKVYEEIQVNSPKSPFKYGTNYIYQSTINIDEYFELALIKSISMELVSDGYFMLKINGFNVSKDYGSFYYMRHSSKSKYYNYGIRRIDLTKYIQKGINEIVIINNISSPVSPVGILPTLIVKYHDNMDLKVDLTSINWSLHTGEVKEGGDIKTFSRLGTQKLSRTDISDSKYELDILNLPDFVQVTNTFIAPKYLSSSKKSIFAPVDIFLFVYFFLMAIITILVLKLKTENKIN